MRFTAANDVKLVIPRRALEVIFDECDRYDADETGGRILGVYKKGGRALNIHVTGIIEPGPHTQRTGTYLKQDGAYQEQIFRKVEEHDPSIEHLGNWHTHHVNGLQHLSGGDIDTYRRTVEHGNHNTDFFHALLVTQKHRRGGGLERYAFKNYLLRRGDPAIYEILPRDVSIVDGPLVWPAALEPAIYVLPSAKQVKAYAKSGQNAESDTVRLTRVYDRDIVSQFYPKVKSFSAEKLGLYWRGEIPLIDGTEVEAIVLEDGSTEPPVYKVTLRNPPAMLARPAEALGAKEFPSCRAALLTAERICNAELFGGRAGNKRRGKWMF